MNVIEVNNLSKKFKLGVYGGKTLRDDFTAWLAKIRGKENPLIAIGDKSRVDQKGEFWALRDINFALKQGEVLGIIGKNGAGKSTLLKLLSRISYPTSGEIRIKGRIASLLEVGTGFHPELTGRENVFLNGAILGMSKRDITNKFDEIVAFSGIEHHIDTPVKRYSSGMKVRLGFAVAAHLEPEILIVDEVLAVGDAEFQKRCLGKMEDVARNGRSIIFVSHNMSAVRNLCSKSILLEDGKLIEEGETEEVIKNYLSLENSEKLITFFKGSEIENQNFVLKSISIDSIPPFSMSSEINIIISLNVIGDISNYDFTINLLTKDETIVFVSSTGENPVNIFDSTESGNISVRVTIPKSLLNAMEYSLNLLVIQNRSRLIKKFESVLSFEIQDIKQDNRYSFAKRKGLVHPILKWEKVN